MKHIYYIKEYLQQADKLYFKKELLSNEDRDNILSITNGDNYTKLVTDIYYNLKNGNANFSFQKSTDILNQFYKYIKEYNKNIFPISNNKGEIMSVLEYSDNLYDILYNRADAIKNLNLLPSLAKRNLKDIRNVTEHNDFKSKAKFLIYINRILDSIDDNTLEKAINKGFKNGNTIEEAYDIIDSIYHSFNSKIKWDYDLNEVLYWIEQENCDIVQRDENVVVLKIYDFETMRNAFGEITNWCFAYSKLDFKQYSTDGYICIIIDLHKKPEDAEYILYYNRNDDDIWVSTDILLRRLNRLEKYSNSVKYLKSIGVNLENLHEN